MEHFLDIPECYCQIENSQFVLLPVPYDGTSTFVKGADKGPQAILDASDSLELYDVVYDVEAYKTGIYTDHFNFDIVTPEKMVNSVYQRVRHFMSLDKIVGILGGEHSVSIGSIRAMSENYSNLSVLQLDAHADLRDEYCESLYNHACVMRRAQEHASIVQVGIRSVCSEEKMNIIPDNMFYAHQIFDKTSWMKEVIDRLSENVYLTVDLDVFDPSILPATGTPLPGGLGWYRIIELLEMLFKRKKVVGFDVVELCPQENDKSSDVLAAALVYKIITLSYLYSNSQH